MACECDTVMNAPTAVVSGARIAGTVARQLAVSGGRYGLATMCAGVGQGVALAIERVN
eukprot:gene51248-62661_t